MRQWTRLGAYLLALPFAVGAVAAAILTGLLGEVVLETPALEPIERTDIAPGRAAVLEAASGACPGQEPLLPATPSAWQDLLERLSWLPTPVTLSDGGRSLAGLSVVVMPGGSCLSTAEAATLRGYVEAGGGLLAAGPLGVRDARSGRAGWGLLKDLLAAERFELFPDGRSALVAFREGSPLAAGLEALSLSPPPRGRVLAVATGVHPYWADSQLQPVDPTLPQAYQSAALTSAFGKGRVAWLGFAVAAGSSSPAAIRGQRLLRSAVTWAAGQPVVSLAQWPGRHRSAVLLRANLAGRPRNAAFVARMLVDARLRGAFVVTEESLGDLAGLDPPLSRAGEIALALRLEPGARPGSSLATAVKRLRIRSVLGAWPSGLLRYDASEEQAALASASAGLEFFLTEGVSGRGRPTVWRATRRFGPWRRRLEVVGFGRRGDDDLGLSPLGLAGLEPQWLRRRLLADFELARALGGLHVLSFHTQGLGAAQYTATLSWLVAEFAARGAWLAGPAQLVEWLRARAGLEMSANASSPGMLSLTLRAPAGAPREPVAVEVHVPPATHIVVASATPDCLTDEPAGDGAQRLILRLGSGTREYRCDLAFVP